MLMGIEKKTHASVIQLFVMLLLLMLILDEAGHQRNKQHAEKEQEVEEKKGGEGGGGEGGGGGGRPTLVGFGWCVGLLTCGVGNVLKQNMCSTTE